MPETRPGGLGGALWLRPAANLGLPADFGFATGILFPPPLGFPAALGLPPGVGFPPGVGLAAGIGFRPVIGLATEISFPPGIGRTPGVGGVRRVGRTAGIGFLPHLGIPVRPGAPGIGSGDNELSVWIGDEPRLWWLRLSRLRLSIPGRLLTTTAGLGGPARFRALMRLKAGPRGRTRRIALRWHDLFTASSN